jgi:hypothetical protein
MNKWSVLVVLTCLVPGLALWAAVSHPDLSDPPYSPIVVPRGAQMTERSHHCVECHGKVECDLEVVKGLEQDMEVCRSLFEEKACVALKKKAIKEQRSCQPRNKA